MIYDSSPAGELAVWRQVIYELNTWNNIQMKTVGRLGSFAVYDPLIRADGDCWVVN
jgi:hypothetical protein